MTPGRPGEGSTEPVEAVRAHAERIVAGDGRAHLDVAPGAEVTPPDLVEWLLTQSFVGFELVAHARIGGHHIFKTKFVGPTTVVIQGRWAAEPRGCWRIREAEVARVDGGPPGVPSPASRPGEV
jgi:hypothetical protein